MLTRYTSRARTPATISKTSHRMVGNRIMDTSSALGSHAVIESLRSLLIALNNEHAYPQSSFQKLSPAQKGELTARLHECKNDLRAVKKVLHEYSSLNTGDPRFRDRLAFTEGKQAALREKIGIHGARFQQFLSGVNIAILSRVEGNTEAHYLSLLEIRAKLDEIHADILAGRRDSVILSNSDGVVAVEDEVLDDCMTEVDVDVSREIHHWMEKMHIEELKSTDTLHMDKLPASVTAMELTGEDPKALDLHATTDDDSLIWSDSSRSSPSPASEYRWNVSPLRYPSLHRLQHSPDHAAEEKDKSQPQDQPEAQKYNVLVQKRR